MLCQPPPISLSLIRIVQAVLGRDRGALERLAGDRNPIVSQAAISAADDLSGEFDLQGFQWNFSGTASPDSTCQSTVTTGQDGSKLVS